MEVHKPKPWSGWREFSKEVGTIVLGVIIALGAEQAVETLHWRHQAEVARGAIAFDLRRVLGQAASKDATSPCVANRLAQFSDALDRAEVTKRLPAVGESGGPSVPGWTMRSWSSLTSGQTLAHMSNRDQLLLSAMANYLENLHSMRNAEQDAWAVLNTMVGPGRPTSGVEIANLRANLGRANQYANGQRASGRQVETLILRSDFLDRKQLRDAYDEGLVQARSMPICQPPIDVTDTHEMIMRGLTGPAAKPGETSVGGVGVSGSITTDR
ncbi:hypothetical protein [Phenylobacterium sp.]|uniref:hypothetical protein n=1 Tax=Phenylobacterium sp. TaxID=1871053 RepID=UPI002DE9C60C|nr:hypothetical protein [Phenylobacterium sp.]